MLLADVFYSDLDKITITAEKTKSHNGDDFKPKKFALSWEIRDQKEFFLRFRSMSKRFICFVVVVFAFLKTDYFLVK